MNAKDIERYLSLVGKELVELDVQELIKLLMIGGSFILTQIRNRSATGDIDTVWLHPEIHSVRNSIVCFKEWFIILHRMRTLITPGSISM